MKDRTTDRERERKEKREASAAQREQQISAHKTRMAEQSHRNSGGSVRLGFLGLARLLRVAARSVRVAVFSFRHVQMDDL